MAAGRRSKNPPHSCARREQNMSSFFHTLVVVGAGLSVANCGGTTRTVPGEGAGGGDAGNAGTDRGSAGRGSGGTISVGSGGSVGGTGGTISVGSGGSVGGTISIGGMISAGGAYPMGGRGGHGGVATGGSPNLPTTQWS